jgi:hypothetical protein
MTCIKAVLAITLLIVFTFSRLSAQPKFINQLELKDSSKVDANEWFYAGINLNVAFGSTDVRYLRHQVPEEIYSNELKITAWKGERVNMQIVIWSVRNSYNINIQPSDLITNDKIISADVVKVFPVRYVMTDKFVQGAGNKKSDSIQCSLAPDMLDNPGTFSISGRSTRPVWVTIDVPDNAKPGFYKGYIEIKAKGRFKKRLHYSLEVQDRILPKPSEWKFHLDLWQHPWSVSRYSSLKEWSTEHWDALRSVLTMLAGAGQKCITTTLVHDPWGGRSFDPYESMVDWLKSSDGGWTFDFTLFDQWVTFAMSCGIKEQIDCYSMIPRDYSFRYFDETDNEYKVLNATPGSSAFENHWRPFLLAFREHLQNKGWMDKTCIALDECDLKDMLSVIKFIKTTTPEFKIAFAGKYNPEIADDIYDLSLLNDSHADSLSIGKRCDNHLPTTFYVSDSKQAHPNDFTFSPLAENTSMGWHAMALGYSGYVRWAYNSWGKDPERDSRFKTLPAGDSYLVYPGARSSIRFELLRAGIQDYEKIRILQESFKKEGTEEANQKLIRLQEMLKPFTLPVQTGNSASILVNRVKEILNELSR